MFRILANNESHGMLSAYVPDEVDKFEGYTAEEKKITSKLSLILIKELNSKHLESYLKENSSVIENWKNLLSKMEE